MKHLLKRLSASLLALTMTVGMGATASAATKSDKVYDLYAKDGTVQFWLNGKKTADYDWSGNLIKLITDKDGDFLVGFKEDRTTDKWISLGDQKTLKIDGSIDAVKILESLDSSIELTVDSGAIIREMELLSGNDLTINGSVPELKVSGAADVHVTKTGSIANARLLNTKATLTIDKEAKVKNVRTRKVLNVKGKGEADKVVAVNSLDYTKEEYDERWDRYYYDDWYDDWYYGRDYDDYDDDDYRRYHIRLDVGTIHANKGDTLSRLRGELDDVVTAYVDDHRSSRDGETISGSVRWENGNPQVLSSDSYSFVFIPTNTKYATRRGSVYIEVKKD